MSVTVVLDQGAIQSLLQSPNGMTARYLIRRGAVIQSRARRNLGGGTGSGPKRIDTGLLRATIYSNIVTVRGGLRVRVGSRLPYALFVHEGTGMFGPLHHRIYPKRARYLRWERHGKTYYRRSVAGSPGNRFLTAALPDAALRTSGL